MQEKTTENTAKNAMNIRPFDICRIFQLTVYDVRVAGRQHTTLNPSTDSRTGTTQCVLCSNHSVANSVFCRPFKRL